MKLSIIIPCKNEEGNVEELNNVLKSTLKDIKYEAIYIDDGSTDKTLEKLKEINKKDKNAKIISFSRNYKKEPAMLAGFEAAIGEYTCVLDADLQQNPSYLLKMIDFLDNNKEYDEVAMIAKLRTQDGALFRLAKKMFYKIIDNLSDVHFESKASDFRMFRENVKNAIINLKEKNRFLKGMFSWVGFKIKYGYYDVAPRKSGKTSFGFLTSLNYAFDGIVSFSTKLLKLANIVAILSFIITFIYLILSLILSTFNIIIFLILLIASVQFLLIGIMSMYMSVMHIEIKNRPVYVIKEKVGFKNE